MNVTITPAVYAHHRRKDGTYPVKIRVTFKGVHRHLATTLSARADQLTRSMKIKDNTLLLHARRLCDEMRGTLAGLSPFALEGWTVDNVVAHVRAELAVQTFRLDFAEWGYQYAGTKGSGTRRVYVTAMNAWQRFAGGRAYDINEITKATVRAFIEFMDAEPRQHWTEKGTHATGRAKAAGGASYRYARKLGTVYDAAREKYNDEDGGRLLIPRRPFAGLRNTMPPSRGQRNLGAEAVARIMRAKTEDARTRTALDAFILSFLTMGANLADMYEAVKPGDGWWCYERRKTRTRRADRAAMRVRIPEEAAPYVARLTGRGSWWLPELRSMGADANKATQEVNRHLRRWAEAEGLEPFTFYAARHSWASIARAAGVEKATIDECLAHVGDYDIADIYIERDWGRLAKANAAVIRTVCAAGREADPRG